MAVTAVERVAVDMAAVLVPAPVVAAVVMKVATGRVRSEDAGRGRGGGGGGGAAGEVRGGERRGGSAERACVLGVCTLAALLGEKDESVRENERMRLTRAAFSTLAPRATPRSRWSTCVSAAAITCVRGVERSDGGASGPGQPPGRTACGHIIE